LSVRIRLARVGAKKKPFYRVVVSDQRSPRDGRFIEIVGRYNPRENPTLLELELDRIHEWIDKGAQPSETVEKLIAIAEAPDAQAPTTAKDERPSKKQAAAAAEAEKAAAEPEEEAAVDEEPVAEESPEEEPAEEPVDDEPPAEEDTASEEPSAEDAEEPVAEESPEEEPAEEPADEAPDDADEATEE
jgi:small subunit ribosomal protein S16